MFPEATYAWRRLKLILAEFLVLSVSKGDHTLSFTENCLETADAIRNFRNLYYPDPRKVEVKF